MIGVILSGVIATWRREESGYREVEKMYFNMIWGRRDDVRDHCGRSGSLSSSPRLRLLITNQGVSVVVAFGQRVIE